MNLDEEGVEINEEVRNSTTFLLLISYFHNCIVISIEFVCQVLDPRYQTTPEFERFVSLTNSFAPFPLFNLMFLRVYTFPVITTNTLLLPPAFDLISHMTLRPSAPAGPNPALDLIYHMTLRPSAPAGLNPAFDLISHMTLRPSAPAGLNPALDLISHMTLGSRRT